MDLDFIKVLEKSATSKSKKGRVKKTTFDLDQGQIHSWKFQDWDYYLKDLPTYARGLFTTDERIIVRGYNKFFNINEVTATKWKSLEAETVGPYECTTKENGCIIFIAGFNGKLLVTSKHSVGPREGYSRHHALEGHAWVRKHLALVNRSESELAQELEANKLTAVGELCDDSFEEHVLEYLPKDSGIYLTGLNRNEAKFKTLPFPKVQEFAAKYGFIVTQFHQCNTLDELKEFSHGCAETGSWNDREIEGFVIRCMTKSRENFFFKYKFDEPYFMYRQWREVTKAFFKDPLNLPRMHARHAASCKEYLKFLAEYTRMHPKYTEMVLNDGKGIIELRKKFLELSTLSEHELVEMGARAESQTIKYVLVPVATLGCGKTTVAVALQQLLKCGHVQNDDFPGSGKSKNHLVTERCSALLGEHDVLMFDRNNHQRRERSQIIDDLNGAAVVRGWTIKFICLNFLPYGPGKADWEVTTKRVLSRGQNHQTIRDMKQDQVVGIMKGFVGRFQTVVPGIAPDDQFDSIIDLKVQKDGSRANVVTILEHLNKLYGFELPDKLSIDAAMKVALSHQAAIPAPKPMALKKKLDFFGVLVDPSLVDVGKLGSKLGIDLSSYEPLKEFHVTIAHPRSHKEAFKHLTTQHAKVLSAPYEVNQGPVDLKLPVVVHVERVCASRRVVALSVRLDGILSANKHPHITLAVAKGARPVESNEMLEAPEVSQNLSIDLPGQLYAYV